MRKAILMKFIHLLFLALILNTFIAFVVTSSLLLKRSREDMHFALKSVDRMLDYRGNVKEQLMELDDLADESRYTLIAMDGTVIADTEVTDVSHMENHLKRQEVKDALQTGYGYSVHRSGTLGMQMAYAAIPSSDGNYILRLSARSTGLAEYMLMLIPAAFLSFGIAFFASVSEAERFSQSITRPLQEISSEMVRMDNDYTSFRFEKCQYDEINVIADTTTNMSRNMKKYLERIDREKQIRQEFFSNASHELKTPITSIRGYVELLESGMIKDQATVKDFLGRIKKEAVRMTSLVDDILMISRLESDGAKVDIISINTSELLDECLSSIDSQVAARGITVHRECEDFIIHADLRQMQELFNNLLTNAVKYNNEGGEIWVQVKHWGADMILTVRDTGVGIPSDCKNRIFERFYRVDKGRSRKQGGTGLGLSIVKHIVNYYHGTVSVKSELGKGSTFTVKLQIAEAK